jgi:uncharacterized protein YdhG (YjbR/CyaY superfamily)
MKRPSNVAPEAQEIISYRMPAFKRHIGLYPPVTGDANLKEWAAPYAGDKGNLRFPLDRPIPYDLIEQIVKLRLKQNLAKPHRLRKAVSYR